MELARIYQRRGDNLCLVGRRPLTHLGGDLLTSRSYCQADLARRGCVRNITSFLKNRELRELDLVIHNAAIGYFGSIEGQSAPNLRKLLTVNLEAPLRLSHALLPWLERGRGKIVMISSVAAFFPCPRYAIYGATKAALDALARSLRMELAPAVTVQVIHPGATRTRMHEKSGMSPEVIAGRRFPSASETATQIARAIEGNRFSVTIGWRNRGQSAAGQLLAVPLDWLLRR